MNADDKAKPVLARALKAPPRRRAQAILEWGFVLVFFALLCLGFGCFVHDDGDFNITAFFGMGPLLIAALLSPIVLPKLWKAFLPTERQAITLADRCIVAAKISILFLITLSIPFFF